MERLKTLELNLLRLSCCCLPWSESVLCPLYFPIPSLPTTLTLAALMKRSSMWNLRKRKDKCVYFCWTQASKSPLYLLLWQEDSTKHRGNKVRQNQGSVVHEGRKDPNLDVCWIQEVHRRGHTIPRLRRQKKNKKPPSHLCNP